MERAIRPVPGEMKKRENLRGIAAKALVWMAHPATKQGAQGIFGRLAGRRPAALSLCQDREAAKACCALDHTGDLSECQPSRIFAAGG